MPGLDEIWVPLVDEPIGGIVEQIEGDDPEIRRLVDSPRRLLAFRTFAYIRAGLVLGQLLVEQDIGPYDGSETWVERLLQDPAHRAEVAKEVRAVAEEIAADPSYAEEESVGPGEDARARFRAFAQEHLRAGEQR
ncbi:MAG: hypothetical protein M3M94_00175 [Actinomycetota bacterium]|nr:hypothetical protein [Actinomycetota bacterium]